LKAALAAEGLFDPAKRRPIPVLPRVIGVVTSPTGAVIRDILHRLADRFPSHVLVWPVLVQGEGAASQIASAVRGFGALAEGGAIPRPDVLIVARGGGSIEDLWAFNEEVVVRAVAASPIPVISAVGHETDTTLCDFAADLRAPTPTAAAEMAVPVRAELLAQVAELDARMGRSVARGMERARERLEARVRLLPRPDMLLSQARQRADDLAERLRRGLQLRVTRAGRELADVAGALRRSLLDMQVDRARERLDRARLVPALLARRIADGKTQLAALSRLHQSLDPDAPLSRGFARVMAGGHVVRFVAEARAAGDVVLKFGDGEVGARVSPATGATEPYGAGGGASGNKPGGPKRPDPAKGQTDLFD
jgi:exodeoxyribonuclease VII large subunit